MRARQAVYGLSCTPRPPISIPPHGPDSPPSPQVIPSPQTQFLWPLLMLLVPLSSIALSFLEITVTWLASPLHDLLLLEAPPELGLIGLPCADLILPRNQPGRDNIFPGQGFGMIPPAGEENPG